MYQIDFLAPVAVRYENASAQPRVIVVGPSLDSTLQNFAWSNHAPRATDLLLDPAQWPFAQGPLNAASPLFPEMGVGLCDISTRQPIFWQLRQKHVNFLFTTTGQIDDLWWAWTLPSQGEGAVVGLQRLDFGRFASVWESSIGQLLPTTHGLRVLISSEEDFNYWNTQALPFQIHFQGAHSLSEAHSFQGGNHLQRNG